MKSSTATVSALYSPHALSVFADRLSRYPRISVEHNGFVVTIPRAGRVFIRQHSGTLTLHIVARDENDLSATMSEIEGELTQSFGHVDFRRSVAISWQRQDQIPVALR